MTLLLQGGTNSATGRRGRRLNSVDRYFLDNGPQLLPTKKTKIEDQLLSDKKTKSERNLPDLSLIFKVWEELKLKYAMFVQQLDRVKEDDILTFSFLGFKFFGKFKIRST